MSFFESGFLQSLIYTKEPFGIINETIYLLAKPDSPSNGISYHCLGEVFPMQESEELSELEKDFIENNKQPIETWLSHVVEQKIRQINGARARLNNAHNLYSSMQDKNIEKFIIIDVFNEYNHDNRQPIDPQHNVDTSQYDNLDLSQRPKLEDLARSHSFQNILPTNGIMVLDNICYELIPKTRGNVKNGFIDNHSNKFSLKFLCPLEEFRKQYDLEIKRKIEATAERHSEPFSRILSQMQNDENNIINNLNNNSVFDVSNSRRGEISFSKQSDDTYNIFLHISPFMIGKYGKYYAFRECKLGTQLKTVNDTIMITGQPILVQPSSYLHPFVYPHKEICTDNYDWSQLGINMGQPYSYTNEADRKAMAKRISILMKKMKRFMTHAYLGTPYTDFTPVHSIDNCPVVANSRSAAESYARNHNIPMHSIYENE